MRETNLIKFRVYPESKRGHYFDVAIYPTATSMRKAANKAGAVRKDFHRIKAGAAVLGTRTPGTKSLGLILFHRQWLGMNVITHECGHAALRWMEAQRFSVEQRPANHKDGWASDNEERFCYALGSMAAQIGNECWNHKLYK